MRTVVLGPWPAELEALIERRRRLGQDRYDEVWEGEYHVSPAPGHRHGVVEYRLAELLGPLARRQGLVTGGAFNLGEPEDYRVPDAGVHREVSPAAFVLSAAMVIEILSPDEETWEKLPFYARHEVDEVLVVDLDERCVTILARTGQRYEPVPRSALLDVAAEELRTGIAWPE